MPTEPGARSASANITMKAVAELAGVSAMTVSRALKSETAVSPRTRARVLEVVRRTGYVPDATARVFASGRSGFVALLIPSINNSNFADTTRGMTAVFERAGLQILLGDTGYSIEREEDLIGALLARRPEAIVLTGGAHTPRAREIIASADIPIVETWDLPAAPLGHVVGFSNVEAGRAMARLSSMRAAIAGSASSAARRIAKSRGTERRRGYLEAMRELGLPEPRIVRFGPPPASMSRAAKRSR